jgi:biopolymer transport protein ExbD
MAARARGRLRRLSPPTILLAPIVDIVFILLIFIMLVSRFLQPALDVELPGSSTAEVTEGSVITLVLDEQGRVRLNGMPLTDKDLVERLSLVSAQEKDLVRLRADKNVKLQRVVEVLDIIRASPVARVALEARPE